MRPVHLSILWMIPSTKGKFQAILFLAEAKYEESFQSISVHQRQKIISTTSIVCIRFREILFPGSYSSFRPFGGAWTLPVYPLTFASSTRNQSECYMFDLTLTVISNWLARTLSGNVEYNMCKFSGDQRPHLSLTDCVNVI